MVFSMLILGFLGSGLAAPLFSMTVEEVQKSLDGGFQNGNVTVLRYFLTIQNVALFLIPALLANYFILNEDQIFLKTGFRHQKVVPALLVFVILLLTLPFVSWLISINSKLVLPDFLAGLEEKLMRMESERGDLTERMLSTRSVASLGMNLLLIAVVPALGEEFFFRGTVQNIFRKWTGSAHAAIWITAVVFSAIHMQFYGFLPRFFLGLLFGYIFFITGSIWLTVWAHFLNNALSVLLVFFLSRQGDAIDGLSGNDTSMPALAIVLSFTGITVLMMLLKKGTPDHEGMI